MIKNISIENFKSIKNLNFEARRVNIFIGEPNTGKSNVLEALGLYSSVYVENLKDIIRFGYANNLFHLNNLHKKIKINLDKRQLMVSNQEDNFSNTEGLELHINDGSNWVINKRFSVEGMQIKAGDKGLALDNLKFNNIKYFKFKVLEKYSSGKFQFLYPPHGSNLFEIITTNEHLLEIVKGIFKQKGFKLFIDSVRRSIGIVLDDKSDFLNFLPYEVISDTLQRVIFYLAAMLSNKNSALIFEEPESHIFPFYNQYLAETIGLDEESGNQYFIATHNPYFLGSIAQKTKIEDLAVFITYMENHETKLRQLREDEYPELFDFDIFYNLDRFIEA